MLYQNILMGERNYHMSVGRLNYFEEHRHADIEFLYCLSGSAEIQIDKVTWHVEEGDVVLIPPMISHGIPHKGTQDRRVLVGVLGADFLKKHFEQFSHGKCGTPVCSLNDGSEMKRKLKAVLEESADLWTSTVQNIDLQIVGNLYKISGYLLEIFYSEAGEDNSRDLRTVASIDKALELIYYNYAEPLTVEEAAAASGYGKSNFCKIFKSVVGDTFHSVLNRQRIENACRLLRETNISVADISQQVGFLEAKTFCRVFKSITGVSPGSYRKSGMSAPTDA